MIAMKPVAVGVLLCMGVLTTPSQAQAVYKCVVGSAITYQQTPCEAPAPAKGVSSNTALIGVWRYDRDTTVAWMKRHAALTKAQEAVLDGLAGHETYTFTNASMSMELTDFDVTVDGKVQHKKGLREAGPYIVLSTSPQMVAISAQNPNTLSMYASDLHFEGSDTMWVSLANEKLTSVEYANAREYFKRVR
jgi:hypothetical protein